MSFINITTNNLSRRLRNSQTVLDNWVFVPGTAITGDWTKPLLFQSLDEFKEVCGDTGVEGSPTFTYVCGLLSAGLPVIFRRIAHKKQNEFQPGVTTPDEADAKCASYTLQQDINGTATDILKISEKYGGSYGNSLQITLGNNTTTRTYTLEVRRNSVLLESYKLCTYTATEEQTPSVIWSRVKDVLTSKDFLESLQKIDIKFLYTGETAPNALFPSITSQPLTGGTDFAHSSVAPVDIIGTLTTENTDKDVTYDNIADKILYHPKFITSGGYMDADLSASENNIAQAMLNVTKVRQDCRALIDIKTSKTPKEVQDEATAISYTQPSSTSIIPSASMCAPWVYMQVGNEQLWMPPSYAYLMVVASDVANGGTTYTPKAGISRGQIPNVIRTEYEIGSAISDKWQKDGEVNVNPIMRLQGGRYIIAGNSTLLATDPEGEDNIFSESSADMAVIEIRRYVYDVASQLQYEYNSTDTFETFALKVGDFLSKMETESAIVDYAITNVSTNDEPRKLKVKIEVYLTPTIKAIEIFLNIAYGEVIMGGE